MASFDDTFAAELRALRPTPSPDFTAKLDERAAAGFPRRPDDGGGKSWWERLRAWFAGLTPRRALVPGGAFALVAVVIATAVVAISGSGGGSGDVAVTSANRRAAAVPNRAKLAEKPAARSRRHPRRMPKERFAAPRKKPASKNRNRAKAPAAAPPMADLLTARPRRRQRSNPPATAISNARRRSSSAPRRTSSPKPRPASTGGPPGERIVLHSTTRGSRHGGEASFDLLIPSGKLNNTLATFSGIAEVRSRHDATTDITAPTVSASEELQDSNARIESLIGQLGEAESEAEREAVEGELRGERDHHAQLRASLERLEDRASMSRVSLRIVSGHGAGVVPSGDSGSWGVGDALHDAGHILAVAGGVVIIGLAVLGPIALILLAVWLSTASASAACASAPSASPALLNRAALLSFRCHIGP